MPGRLTAEAIVRAHLDRIDQRDADVLAWSHLAREAALERARVLDRGPRQGLLHGIPMGVKDIIDSYDQPTTYGSPIYKTHQPLADAATVALATRRRRDPAGQDGDDGIRQPLSRARPRIRTIPRTRRAVPRPARPRRSPTSR